MKYLAANFALAVLWSLLLGEGDQLLAGFLAGYLVLVLARPFLRCERYVRAVPGALRLAGHFVVQLIVANLRLARDVLRPSPPFAPAFLKIETHALTRAQTVLLANLVSLTPGSITVDVLDERTLYVHTLYAADEPRAIASVQRFARLIRGAFGEELP